MPTSGPHEVAFAIRGPITRADLPGLCDRVCALLRGSGDVVACDVAGVDPDAVTVDALARLQLAARRLGCEVRLRNASAALLEVVELMGLTHVLAEREHRQAVGEPGAGFRPSRAGNPPAMTDFTLKNLGEVEDMAVRGGFSEFQEARFAGADLGLDTLGVSYQVVKPGKHHAFGHRHKRPWRCTSSSRVPGSCIWTTTRSGEAAGRDARAPRPAASRERRGPRLVFSPSTGAELVEIRH